MPWKVVDKRRIENIIAKSRDTINKISLNIPAEENLISEARVKNTI